MEQIVVAVIALLAGAVGSLLAPWAQWGVEKRRDDRAHRRGLLSTWRSGIAGYEAEQGRRLSNGPQPFVTTAWYATLRPRLSEEAVRELEGSTVLVSGGRNAYVTRLHAEVDRIEREWKLA